MKGPAAIADCLYSKSRSLAQDIEPLIQAGAVVGR
jgi:hypothetical protein